MDDQDINKTEMDSDRTMVTPAAGGEATLLGTTVTCPVCGTENAPSEKYCGDCGFLLSSTPGEAAPAIDAGEQPKLIDSSDKREYLLCEGENTVGRETADILLADSTVSRRHALVVLEGGKCWVQDSGSTNGTFVNSEQLRPDEKMEIFDGMELKFGSTIVTLALPVAPNVEETVEESTVEATVEETPADGGTVEASVEETPAEEAVSEADMAPEIAEAEETPVPGPDVVARLVTKIDPAKEFAIMPGLNTIGRRMENNIVLTEDSFISGSHAELVADERGFWLTDIGSTNGTTLNGSKIEPGNKMAVSFGDEIMIGQTALGFEMPAESDTESSVNETKDDE